MTAQHDPIMLSLEQSLDHCIKCNICTAACPVAAVTDKFPGPKYVGPQAQRFRTPDQPSPDASVDYCSGCRVCNEVCPTGVQIAELNARARAQIVADRGMPLRNRLVGRAELLGRLGCGPQAPLANFTLANRPLRLLIERVMGIASRAPLPSFSPYSFRAWFRKRQTADGSSNDGRRQTANGSTTNSIESSGRRSAVGGREQGEPGGRRQVVYFHGCATNYYEPEVGKAAVAVLEHNGFEVILARQNCCGLPLLSNGEFAAGRRYHLANMRKLLPYVRQGIPIVGTSTSCTLTLKEEAPELLGMHGDDARLLAENTFDIFEFLRDLAVRGELATDFASGERELPYHPPCQLRAHRIGLPARDVLELIPGLRLRESHADCCGIAGTYGIKREKYQIGMDVGAGLFDFVRGAGSEVALCDSETCRWQITHGSGVAAQHPIQVLAQAYGVAHG